METVSHFPSCHPLLYSHDGDRPFVFISHPLLCIKISSLYLIEKSCLCAALLLLVTFSAEVEFEKDTCINITINHNNRKVPWLYFRAV